MLIVLENHWQPSENVMYERFVAEVKNLEKQQIRPLPNYTKFVIGMKDVGVRTKRLSRLTNCQGFLQPVQILLLLPSMQNLDRSGFLKYEQQVKKLRTLLQRYWKKPPTARHPGLVCQALQHTDWIFSMNLSKEQKIVFPKYLPLWSVGRKGYFQQNWAEMPSGIISTGCNVLRMLLTSEPHLAM